MRSWIIYTMADHGYKVTKSSYALLHRSNRSRALTPDTRSAMSPGRRSVPVFERQFEATSSDTRRMPDAAPGCRARRDRYRTPSSINRDNRDLRQVDLQTLAQVAQAWPEVTPC